MKQRTRLQNISVKIKTFLYHLSILLLKPIRFIQRLHNRIIQVDEYSITQRKQSRNPYQMFQDWLLDLIVYGLTLFPLYVVLFGWPGLKYSILVMVAIGLTRWWVLNMYQDYIKVKHEE